MSQIKIRRASEEDWAQIWEIFRTVVSDGDTYAIDPGVSEDAAREMWMSDAVRTYAAEGEIIVGTYILKPNQGGPGAHVANAAFMVSPSGRGRGIGRKMGEHAISEARRLGYRGMQFNFVVSTNTVAVRLWESLEFRIVGTLPRAFEHPREGYVDAYVMYRDLCSPEAPFLRSQAKPGNEERARG